MSAGNVWTASAVCLQTERDPRASAPAVYERVCRTEFSAPGFCLVNLGSEIGSPGLRREMVALKAELAALHEVRAGRTLVYVSAARFDQQTTTRPHLDGGPEESLIMLGYEPSGVPSELEIADYARCAFDLGLTPKEFLARHNPMFRAGQALLQPYTTRIPCFSPVNYQIVLINNSSAPYSTAGQTWQGTLHTATIAAPDERERRVINSTMIAPADLGADDHISPADLHDFLTTTAVRRQGYDKQHLQDDA